MQRHGRGGRKKRKSKLQDFQGFQTVSLFKDVGDSDTDAYRKAGRESSEEPLFDDSLDYVGDPRDISLTMDSVDIGQQPNASQIGQEFSGITDRISKVGDMRSPDYGEG